MIKEKTTKGGGGAGRAKKWNPTQKKKEASGPFGQPPKSPLGNLYEASSASLLSCLLYTSDAADE